MEPSADALTRTQTHVAAMLCDGACCMPLLAPGRPLGSLFDVKVVLLSTERDDARPILFEPSAEAPRVISILGDRIDHNTADLFGLDTAIGDWVLLAEPGAVRLNVVDEDGTFHLGMPESVR
jgi:hypothetical protein